MNSNYRLLAELVGHKLDVIQIHVDEINEASQTVSGSGAYAWDCPFCQTEYQE